MEDYGYVHDILENLIPHSCSEPRFHFEQRRADGDVYRMLGSREEKKRRQYICCICDTEPSLSLCVCEPTIPYSTQLSRDRIVLSQSIKLEHINKCHMNCKEEG